MKRLLFLLLVWLYPIIGFSGNLIIDEYKTDVYFANGILTDEGNATANTILLKRIIQKDTYQLKPNEYNSHIGGIYSAYNSTHGTYWDIIESAAQKLGMQTLKDLLFDTVHKADIDLQITNYKNSIKNGHRVLVVAHSQGNLFTNDAYKAIIGSKIDFWMSRYFKVVSIASPAHFEITPDTPEISWDNDVVADLGLDLSSGRTVNTVRKIRWRPHNMDLIIGRPSHEYVYSWQVGDTYRNAWKAEEWLQDKFNSNVHSFTFYMGQAIKDRDTGEIFKNPFDDKVLKANVAKDLIMAAIKSQLDELEKRSSQWKPKNLGCQCKDKYAKMTHVYDSENIKFPNNEKVKDFTQDTAGKIYQVDGKYIRALEGGVEIEEINESEACYTLKDDKSSEIGKIEGKQKMPSPKPGAIEVTVTWENPSIDFDLDVKWGAGEHDVKDTGCPMEHFYVETQYDIYSGTYPIYVTHKKEEDNESKLIPEKMKVIISVPGKTEIYNIDINETKDLEVGHVADIFVKYIDDEIVPGIRTNAEYTPEITINTGSSEEGSSDGGASSGGSSSGGSSGKYHWVPIDDTCTESCGCIPCEYQIIPYLEQLLYGPLSGADFELYEAVNYQNKEPVYTGKTTSGNTLYTAGNIEIPDSIVEVLHDDTLYLLVAKGGLDIDHNDDFRIDDLPTVNQGETHLLLTGKDIKEIGFKANVLTEIAYQIVKGMIDVNSTQEVQNKLNEVALRVLNDKVYSDANGSINYKDLSLWLPTVHKPLLIADYQEMVAPLVENLFANRDIYQEAYDVVYHPGGAIPVLQSERYEIDESITRGMVVGKITVVNQGESAIKSFVLEGEGKENFEIDSNGQIAVSENDNLDYETKTYYKLYVSASNDNGSSKKVLIFIKLRNISDSPELKDYRTSALYEDTPVDSEVLMLEFDPGSSALQAAVLTGEGNEYFTTEIVDNNVIVKVAKTLLGYLSKRAYELQLKVSNATESSRSTPFALIVGDRRDIPILRNTQLYIEENATTGTIVGKVNIISDGYSPITEFKARMYYSNSWPEDYFIIDNNGIIRVGSSANFDYETHRSYSSKIKAVNAMGESQEVYVSINLLNIPDTPPSFYYTQALEILSLGKYVKVGTVIGKLNVYKGDSPLTSFRLEPNSPFSIDMEGNIKIDSSLQNIEIFEYNLTAIAGNVTGYSNAKPVHITINRNSYEFSVLEGTHEAFVGKIDIGSDTVEQIMIPLPARNYFTIDTNGTLSTAASDDRRQNTLNSQENNQHSFTATVEYENGITKNFGIVVNVQSRVLATLNTPGVTKAVVLNEAENRAYIADYDHGMHIVDISDAGNPAIITSVDTDGAANDLVLSKDEKYLYLLDVGKGLKVIDVSDESSPELVSEVEILGYSFNVTLSPDGNHAFISHGRYGVEVVDISEPNSPEIITNIGFMGVLESSYGNIVNSYSEYVSVSSDGKRIYVADWAYGMQIIDISDIMNPISLFSESLRPGQYRYSAIYVTVDEKQNIAIISSTNDTSHTIYNISNISKTYKFACPFDTTPIEIIDRDLAYNSIEYGLSISDFTNPAYPRRIAYINLGQTHGMTLDKGNKLTYVANDRKGLTIVNLEGIGQPNHQEPTVLDTAIDILESDIQSISVGDIIGQVRIWNDGDSFITRTWTEAFRNQYGDIVCDDDSYWRCDDYDEHSYFDIDINGSIMMNSSESLVYGSVGNQILFAAYTENENGHKSNQAKVTINIKEDPSWSLQLQKNIIKIDNNVSVGTAIANVLARKSERELFLIGVYEPYYWCSPEDAKEKTRDGYTYKEAIEKICVKSQLFTIDKNGTIFTKDTLASGNYAVDIITVDRFGLRWLKNQAIEVLEL